MWIHFSYVDTIYYAAITLTTVGYGDYTPKTDNDRLFTCFYILFGVSICGTTITFLLAQIVENYNERKVKQNVSFFIVVIYISIDSSEFNFAVTGRYCNNNWKSYWKKKDDVNWSSCSSPKSWIAKCWHCQPSHIPPIFTAADSTETFGENKIFIFLRGRSWRERVDYWCDVTIFFA